MISTSYQVKGVRFRTRLSLPKVLAVQKVIMAAVVEWVLAQVEAFGTVYRARPLAPGK